VFRACIEPAELATWWGPAGFSCQSVDLDPRVGGSYRITMQPPEGDPFHLTGKFVEVEAPKRLAYTFVWEEPDPDDRETVATLSFEDLGGATELRLDQRSFATEARYELHRDGWTEGLERLAESFASG